MLHEAVAEAAVAGFPPDVTGQGIYAHVTPKAGMVSLADLRTSLGAQLSWLIPDYDAVKDLFELEGRPLGWTPFRGNHQSVDEETWRAFLQVDFDTSPYR